MSILHGFARPPWPLRVACWITLMALALAVPGILHAQNPAGPSVTLAWEQNPEPDIAGYRIYYGATTGNHPGVVDVGNVTTAVIPLPAYGTFYVVATAYNTAALESLPSDELQVLAVPADSLPPVITGIPGSLVVRPGVPGGTTAVVTWTEPVASDNTPGVTLTRTHAPGATFPPGTTPVVYTAQDTSGNVTTASFTVTVAGLELWKMAEFGAEYQNPALAGDAADADDDRWSNLAEYALGLNTHRNDGAQVLRETFVDDTVILRFRHNAYLPDAILRVESTESLTSPWTPVATRLTSGLWTAGGPAISVATAAEGGHSAVEISEILGPKSAAFYRLRVEKAPL